MNISRACHERHLRKIEIGVNDQHLPLLLPSVKVENVIYFAEGTLERQQMLSSVEK